jgi:hypothetical protein
MAPGAAGRAAALRENSGCEERGQQNESHGTLHLNCRRFSGPRRRLMEGMFLRAKPLELVEHQIHDHSGHADVHPDRPGPLGEPAVTRELSLKSPAQRHDGENRNRNRKQGVGNQNGEIDHGDGPGVMLRPSDFYVIGHVRNQERDGSAERRQHHLVMGFALPVFDEIKADAEQNGGRSIKNGVEGGQVVDGQNFSLETCLASAITRGIASSSDVR